MLHVSMWTVLKRDLSRPRYIPCNIMALLQFNFNFIVVLPTNLGERQTQPIWQLLSSPSKLMRISEPSNEQLKLNLMLAKRFHSLTRNLTRSARVACSWPFKKNTPMIDPFLQNDSFMRRLRFLCSDFDRRRSLTFNQSSEGPAVVSSRILIWSLKVAILWG